MLWFKLNNSGRALDRYDLEILHQDGQRFKTKGEKDFRANSYVCTGYREKTGRRAFMAPS